MFSRYLVLKKELHHVYPCVTGGTTAALTIFPTRGAKIVDYPISVKVYRPRSLVRRISSLRSLDPERVK